MAQIWNPLFKFIQYVKSFVNSTQSFKSFSNQKSQRNAFRGNYKRTMFLKTLSSSFLFGVLGKKKEPDTAEEVVHKVAMATIALKDGNIEKSGNMLFKTLDFSEANNFRDGVISACDMLSSLAMKIGDYEKAEILVLKALDNLYSQGTPEDDNYVVSFNLKLSRLYSNTGNDALAEKSFKNCVKLQRNKIKKIPDEETFLLWTTILYWYGKFLQKQKRIKEAKSCFKDCFKSSLQLENLLPSQIMVILYNLGEVCEILGEHDEAIEYFLEGVSLDKKQKNPDLTYFYSKLGMCFMSKGLFKEAKLWCDQAKRFALKYKNLDGERESNECLEKLNAMFHRFILNLHHEGSRKLRRNVMNELKIDKYRITDDGNKKPFCVYFVEASINGGKFIVEKRYSQFHALHGELRKLYPTPYFPPKKVRSLQQRVLEERRQALEKYLQTMLSFNQSRSHVLSFLGINKPETEYDLEKINEVKPGHQPLFQFKKDFIPHGSRKSNLPDIIEDGVLLGFYKTS